MRDYPCEYCDTELPQQQKLVRLTLPRDKKLFIFENVTAMVCPNCGHRYFDGELVRRLERMTADMPSSASPVEAWSIDVNDL